MFESFKTVLEKEREAEQIIFDTKEQAELLIKKAQEKSELVYKKTYNKTIDKAKQKARKIKEKAKKDGESNAQVFIEKAENLKKKFSISAKKRFNEATNKILQEILT